MPLRLCEQAAGVTAASPASPCQLVPPHPPQALRLRPCGGPGALAAAPASASRRVWSAGSGSGSGARGPRCVGSVWFDIARRFRAGWGALAAAQP